ncbi:hypothetical protein ZWY2020_015042 [Hordeum vulgare]|nr:hypothetical protein ZWY2020_015042 [Hordeum vulgare]
MPLRRQPPLTPGSTCASSTLPYQLAPTGASLPAAPSPSRPPTPTPPFRMAKLHLPAPQLRVRHRQPEPRADGPEGPRGREVPLRAGHALRGAPRRRGGRRARPRRHRLPQPRARRLLGTAQPSPPSCRCSLNEPPFATSFNFSNSIAISLKIVINPNVDVNAPLLLPSCLRVPFSVLKYAMTADVFELRGRSDAVIVGGNTIRRDVRIVMSQTCNLPEEANLWNVHEAYTIVATQRGARRDFQKKLAMKGVEVVEFDILNPRDVMSYCYDREVPFCIMEVWFYAFCAPKIIGGVTAPTPVGDLGMNQMTQAIDLIDVSYEQVNSLYFHFQFLYVFCINYISMRYISNDNCTCEPVSEPTSFTQAHKFVGVENPQASNIVQEIKRARRRSC